MKGGGMEWRMFCGGWESSRTAERLLKWLGILKNPSEMLRGILENLWRIFGESLENLWRIFGGSLEISSDGLEILFKCPKMPENLQESQRIPENLRESLFMSA